MTGRGSDAGGPRPGIDGRVLAEGDEHPRALLEPTLNWAAERIDAVFGTCAILSGRGEAISCAWGLAHPAGAKTRPRLEARLREDALGVGYVEALGKRLEGDPTLPTVFAQRADEVPPGVVLLLERLELSLPLVLTLRSRGRLAGLLLVCRAAASAVATADAARLLRRVHTLVETALDLDAVMAWRFLDPDIGRAHGLTAREQSIVELVVAGAGNAEIASELGIARTTVRNHMTRILRKLGVRTRAQLIAFYAGSERTGQMGE